MKHIKPIFPSLEGLESGLEIMKGGYKMKQSRKVLAVLLALVMVITMIPQNALAAKNKSKKKKYTVEISYVYSNGTKAAKTVKKSYPAGKKKVKATVNVPKKKGFTATMTRKETKKAKKLFTKFQFNGKKIKYQLKKAKKNIKIQVVYVKNKTEKTTKAKEPTKPAEEDTSAAPAEDDTAAPAEDNTAAEGFLTSGSFAETMGSTSVDVKVPEGAFDVPVKLELGKASSADEEAIRDQIDGDIVDMALVDISFLDEDGNELEPAKKIDVSIETNNLKKADNYTLYHLNKEGVVEEVTPPELEEVSNDAAAFSSDQFSVYAIVALSIDVKGGNYKAEDNGVSVEVTTKDNTFTESVVLYVSAISEDSDAYKAAEKELADIDHEYDGMVAYDIHFVSAATGKEVEPDKAVDVSLKITDAEKAGVPEEAVGAVTVAHIFDKGGAEIVSEPDGLFIPSEDDNIQEFETEVFSTFTITWRNNARRVTVHYVDENGTELTISNPNNTHPDMTASSSSPAFLIYDIAGYEYSYTYRNTNTNANRIAPILSKNNSNYWRYTTSVTSTGNVNNWEELNNNDNIYVVYKKKADPTTGGTPSVDTEEEWPDEETPARKPQFGKSSTNNGNGTNKVSLSISGPEKPVEKTTPADVIVVFDISRSMITNNMGNVTRLQAAKNATNTMARTLLTGENKDVRMALITFSTTAEIKQEFTNNYTTFSGKVNGLEADGGTNWEQALQLANKMEVRSDAATFVVFVTDGDPTFRMTRGDFANNELEMYNSNTTYRYYRNNNVFGDGQDTAGHETTVSRCFDAAVPEVSSINESNKNFYAIGISNSVTKVRNLTTQGGVDASHAFIASDNAAMENAFKSITEAIKSILGFGDIEITDGITALSHTEMKVLESVDPDSFKYYRYGGEGNKYGADYSTKTEWTTREADGCAAASYDKSNDTVHWNMGETFQLEDGVTYIVEFTVWPSQEAYDLVADLNNGIRSYDTLTDDEKAQIVKRDTVPVTYALKTNTDTVNATYSQTTKTGDTVTVSGEHDLDADYNPGTMQNMNLTSMLLRIKKEFEDDLTAGEDRDTEVTLVLQRRNAHQTPEAEFEPYAVPQSSGTSANIVLNEGNNWTYSLYVAPGFEVDGEVLEHGYDFTITEPDIDYHYGVIEEIINPMVVDGQEKYYGDGYLIEDEETIAEYTDQALTAVNRVKSGIDIKKVVYDTDGTTEIYPDTEFTFTGKLLGPDGQPYTWKDGDDVDNTGAYHKFDKDGNRIIYKGHFADTSNISFTLKAGEYLRFINVPDGCTFQFTEPTSGLAALGFEWVKTEAVTQHRTSPGGPFSPEGDVQPDVSGQTASLEGDKSVVGNKQYAITYSNKVKGNPYFYVYHSKDNTVEKISVFDERVGTATFTNNKWTCTGFDIVKETKADCLYGGYYEDYPKKGSGYDSATQEYDENNWSTDVKEGVTPYTGDPEIWNSDDAHTVNGFSMNPEAAETYYLKEVPDTYLRIGHFETFNNYKIHDNCYLYNLHLLSAVDDNNYRAAGFDDYATLVDKDGQSTATHWQGKLYEKVTVTYPGIDPPEAEYIPEIVLSDIAGMSDSSKGFILMAPHKKTYDVGDEEGSKLDDESYNFVPYFITPDYVKVNGIRIKNIALKDNVDDGDGHINATCSKNHGLTSEITTVLYKFSQTRKYIKDFISNYTPITEF